MPDDKTLLIMKKGLSSAALYSGLIAMIGGAIGGILASLYFGTISKSVAITDQIAAIQRGDDLDHEVLERFFRDLGEQRDDLAGLDLVALELSEIDLSNANLAKANLTRSSLRNADLTGADLSFTDLVGSNLAGANLKGASLRYANLSNAFLEKANLEGADLTGAVLHGAQLQEAIFLGANLTRATFQGVSGMSDAELDLGKVCGTIGVKGQTLAPYCEEP